MTGTVPLGYDGQCALPCHPRYTIMFAVLFEVHRSSDKLDTYLPLAKMQRPESESVPSFISNIRYRNLPQQGWIFSLSTWKDEKAIDRWGTSAKHHMVQVRPGWICSFWTIISGLGRSVLTLNLPMDTRGKVNSLERMRQKSGKEHQ